MGWICDLRTWKAEEGALEFRINLGYIVRSKLAGKGGELSVILSDLKNFFKTGLDTRKKD